MVARGRSWIPVVPTSSMVIAFTLLFLLVGWPLQGISAESAADSKAPTATECRRHVEKALDQYFDSNDKATIGDQGTTKKAETPTPPSQLHPSSNLEEDDDDEDDNDPPVSVTEQDKQEDDDEDEDDEDEDENDEDDDDDDEEEGNTPTNEMKNDRSKEHETGNSEVDDADDDDDNDDDDDDEDDEDEEDEEDEDDDKTGLDNKTGKFDAQKETKEGVKDQDEDEDDEDDDNDEENDDKNENSKHADDDDEDDDEDDDDEEDVKETKKETASADDDDDEEEEEDDEEEEKDQQDEDDEEEEVEEEKKKAEVAEEEEDEDEEEDDEDEEETTDEKDEEDEVKEKEKEEEKKESKVIAPKENLTVTVTISKKAIPEEIPRKIPDILAKYRRVPPSTAEQVASKEPEKEEKGDKDGKKADGDDDHEHEKDKTTSTFKAPLSAQKPIPKKTEEESLKVTGPSDYVAPGMAQGFPRREPIPQQPKAQKDAQETAETVKKMPLEGNVIDSKPVHKVVKDEVEHEDEDAVENIYEEDEADEGPSGLHFRSRDHIDAVLGLDEIGTDYDHQEDKLAQTIFKDIKKIHATSIKPMEMQYKFTDSTTRLLGDAEIFGKPMILFLGPWNTGKTTIINYLLGIERTPSALKTGTGITDVDFTVINYGDQRQTISGTELAADWRYASLQKFGQGFLDHFKSVTMPHTLLKKIALVDTPGILESRKNTDRGYSLSDAFQWFIDRADAIYVVLDPNKVDIGAELGAVLDQLKGRDVRFVLNKADTIRRSDLMKVVGQLFWNLSPLMSGTEAPVIYAVSLSTKPFSLTAPAKFLSDQENNFLYDLKDTMDRRVENRILYARRHAVRVRNHAKMIDCYLATYYRTKSIFSSKRNVAKLITENPTEYQIYEGLSSMTNVSRYDLPDPMTYKNFFKVHPLYDFKPLASTCSYFRGCPMDKLDNAIANELPELFTKYKKAKNDSPQPAAKKDGR